jgi:CRP/FNR family cyclic AMP-dependent transcriptional regulator
MAFDIALLETDRWFGDIPVERRTLLLGGARERSVEAGARLYGMGDEPNGLWAVLDGQVRLKGYSDRGAELLALILRPGTWFGELSTLDAKPRPHDAIAFGAARVLHISMSAFARAAAAEPGLYRDLGLLVCAHQRNTIAYVMQNLAQSVRVRLARTLVRSARGEDSELHIKQEELATIIGVSRQTLNRTLKQLEREGIVDVSYALVRVRDLAGLHAVGAEG